MDFLEDFDDIFDQILDDGQSGDAEGFALNDAETQNEIADLKRLLAEENRVPMLALFAGMKKMKRPSFLAALAGAVDYVAPLEMDENQSKRLAKIAALLRTRRKGLRRLLLAGQADQLSALFSELGNCEDEDAMRQIWDYVLKISEATPDEVYKLFRVGLWSFEKLQTGGSEEVGLLAQLSGDRIAELRAASKRS